MIHHGRNDKKNNLMLANQLHITTKKSCTKISLQSTPVEKIKNVELVNTKFFRYFRLWDSYTKFNAGKQIE